MKKFPYMKVLIGVLIISAILRIVGIGIESLWLDEVISVRWAQAPYLEAFRYVMNDVHMPLYMTVLWGWVRLFGITEISVRVLSTIFGIASVYFVYLLGKELKNEKVGLISAFIISLSPIAIYYSQEARMYSLLMFLTILSFYGLIKYYKNKDCKLYVISSILMLYTHIFGVLIIGLQNLYHLIKEKNKNLKKWIFLQGSIILLYIPGLIILYNQLKDPVSNMWLGKPSFSILLKTFYELFGSNILFLFFCCLLIVFVYLQYSKKRIYSVLLPSLWVILPLFIVYIYSLFFTPLFLTRYFVFIVPGIALLFGFFIAKLNNKWLIFTALLIFVLLSFNPLYKQDSTLEKDNWKDASFYLKERVDSEPILVHPFYHQDPFTYYFDKECFKERDIYTCNYENNNVLSLKYDADCCDAETKLTATDGMDELGDYNGTLWFVSVRSNLYPGGEKLFEYLNSSKNLAETAIFEGDIKVYKFE